MRPRFVYALAALAALAACDQAGQKGGPARAPIGAAPPAKTTTVAAATPAPAANCPTVKPVCPTTPAKAVARKAKVHRLAVAAPARAHRIVSTETRSYARRDDGLPRRPYRYDELPRDRQAVITLPYADDYAGPPYPHAGYHRWKRQDGYARGDGHGMHREQHAYRYEENPPPPRYAPPPEDREPRGWRQGERSERRWGERDGVEVAPLPPPPPPPAPTPAPRYDRYGQSQGYDRYDHAYGGYEHREYRSYSEESSESATVERDCCAAGGGQAAGFDAHGYLTWPGKTPR